jgi:hypothetical protein
MIYAPVVIPTLCRHEHLKRGLDSLAANSWARSTDVFIALDYPPSDKYVDAWMKTKEMLKVYPKDSFKSFNVVERECNYGPGRNFGELFRVCIESRYDRYIYAEDDLEFAPNFLEYMDKCLDYFEDDASVCAISGYSYPLSWKLTPGSSVFLSQATYSTWGVGQWVKKRKQVINDIVNEKYLLRNFDHAFKEGLVDRMIAGRKSEYVAYATLGVCKDMMESDTDMSQGPYLLLSGKRVVIPYVSKTRNHGFDGTGNRCGSIGDARGKHSLDYDYSNQPLDTAVTFNLVVEQDGANVDANHRLLSSFLYVSRKRRILEKVGCGIYRAFGAGGCNAAKCTYDTARLLYRKIKGCA